MVKLFPFKSAGWNLNALTLDQTGGNLPAEYGPWLPDGKRLGLSIDDVGGGVLRSVHQRGFFVINGSGIRRRL